MSGRPPWAAVSIPPVRASTGRQLFTALLAGLLACAAGLAPLQAQAGRLGIELADGTPEEAQARTQLHRLVREFDLAPWLFTRRVRIQAMAIPHKTADYPNLGEHVTFGAKRSALLWDKALNRYQGVGH